MTYPDFYPNTVPPTGGYNTPAAPGTAGVLTNDGTGELSWEPPGLTQADADARYVNIAGDTMTGGLALDGADLTLNSAAVATKRIVASTGGLARFSLSMTSGAGEDLALSRHNDDGASAATAWRINRLTGEWAIGGGAPIAGISATIQVPSGNTIGRALVLANPSPSPSSSVDVQFRTAANLATRGRIQGQKEGAADNGSLVFSTFIGSTEATVLTLSSAKLATFTGVVAVANGTAAAPSVRGSAANTGLALTATTAILTTTGVARLTADGTALTASVPMILPADPTIALQAATKSYVDAGDAAGHAALPLAGGTMTGPILLPNGGGAAPSIGFTTSPTSGLMWSAYGPLLINAGTARLAIDPAGCTVLGTATVWSDFTRSTSARLVVDKRIGSAAIIASGANNAALRWQFALGDATAEAGANVGSDFTLTSFPDAGGPTGSVRMRMKRADGATEFFGPVTTPSGTVLAPSDARIKTNVTPYAPGLAAILALRPVRFRYDYRTGYATGLHVGLIAQDAEIYIPDAVSKRPSNAEADLTGTGWLEGIDDLRQVDIGPIVYTLVNAVRDLAAQNAAMAARLALLEAAAKPGYANEPRP